MTDRQEMEKHQIKKSSYYVWFLGAKESRGLRGDEFISPVVNHLMGKELQQAPIKVTLQLSNKGLKIIQNVSGKRIHDTYRGEESVKHFIPHHAITCVTQADKPNQDVVSCILLIYNPATSCPVHVHSYRCDSVETARLLRDQLSVLVERPDNQKKFLEIESRLQEKGLLHRNASNAGSSKLGSDGRSLGRGSDSGAGSDKGSQLNTSEKIASMYDSLAAELREKLGGKQPLLLPPRDYDTVHRSRGNVITTEERRSLNPNVVGTIGVMADTADSEGKSSGIGSEDAPSPSHHTQEFLTSRDLGSDRSSSDEEWAEGARVGQVSDSSLILQTGWPDQPLSARFFQPRSRSGSSPPHKLGAGRKERPGSPDCSAKDRFKGAKQLFMSLERKKDKDRRPSSSPLRGRVSPQRTGQHLEKLVSKDLSESEGRRVVEESADSRWPKSDRDTGYVSRYSRDKSRSRDFDESPPASSARPAMFVKSGKKSSQDRPGRAVQSKRLNRFLSRETLGESDGYDKIEELEEVERQRNKVMRQPSRTSLKLSRDREEEAPRRGLMRREVTEVDLKGYMRAETGFSRKYNSPVWAGPRERYEGTKVLVPEFRSARDNRYPSLDLRNEKRKSMYEGAGDVIARRHPPHPPHHPHHPHPPHHHYPQPNTDYRRRSYHELSDVDKLDMAARNFQHSGRKMCPEPLGLGPRPTNVRPYRIIPDQQRYPGLDRDSSRQPFKNTIYHPSRTPRSFDNRPAMLRHSYAEPLSSLASIKHY